MKTRENMLHSCDDCVHAYVSNVGKDRLVQCSVYPSHTLVNKDHFCGQWSHKSNYEREYNESKNQLTVTE